jgi:hypothetical protein
VAGVAALNAVAAWGGAVALLTGVMDFGGVIDERLPFDSLVLAGVSLATVVAIPLTVLAWSAWTGAARTDDVALVVGVMLCGWILLQVVVLQAFSPFQPAYLCVGAYFVAASNRVRLGPGQGGVLVATIGAVVTSVGVGLLPHPIRSGLSVTSVVSLAALTTGIGCLVVGVRSALRDRRRLVRLSGAAATVMVVAVSVSVIAPAVAATHVARCLVRPGSERRRSRRVARRRFDPIKRARPVDRARRCRVRTVAGRRPRPRRQPRAGDGLRLVRRP